MLRDDDTRTPLGDVLDPGEPEHVALAREERDRGLERAMARNRRSEIDHENRDGERLLIWQSLSCA